jgi:hypothetical protein
MGSPTMVNTMASRQAGKSCRWPASAPTTTCGSGIVRTLAAVLGGARYGPAGQRHELPVDLDRPTQEVDPVDGQTEALALPHAGPGAMLVQYVLADELAISITRCVRRSVG